MYSGLMLTRYAGRILGAHQKIDRTARRRLEKLVETKKFPKYREIVRFEGKNGPDGIKVKSPAQDEPWHFYNPFDNDDTKLLGIIQDHYKLLVGELKQGNRERASFEAAWLAHALVDGLTPAHQFPFEEKMSVLRSGENADTRTTFKEKLIMHGDTPFEKIRNNWAMWGARGLFSTHILFELGVATLILPLNFGELVFSQQELDEALQLGIVEIFERTAKEVGVLEMYHGYTETGWTARLANDVRHKLGPLLVRTVTLAWYTAAIEAGMKPKQVSQ